MADSQYSCTLTEYRKGTNHHDTGLSTQREEWHCDFLSRWKERYIRLFTHLFGWG